MSEPNPRWARIPPGADGWYWTIYVNPKTGKLDAPRIMMLDRGLTYVSGCDESEPIEAGSKYLWWPIPIRPPEVTG